MTIDSARARELLDSEFSQVLATMHGGSPPAPIPDELADDCDRVFSSKTQAYREALLGCLPAKILDPTIDVRKPYVNLGERAYNGRTMDEAVVNPFLHKNQIPSSKGPYLSVFRRSVTFDETTRPGVRDKVGFDAMLGCVAYISNPTHQAHLIQLLHNLLHRFIQLREAASIPLSKLQRFSLPQYAILIDCLLKAPSGGRFPVFLTVSAFKAISARFKLGWHVEFQGINVSDRASGAGGDIMIRSGDSLLMAAEVTERLVGHDRVVATFNTKIAPASIEDYLFFVNQEPDDRVRRQCHQYFAQGHEVSFVQIATWLNIMLTTIGKAGRERFNLEVLNLLEDVATPQSVRVAWNKAVEDVINVV